MKPHRHKRNRELLIVLSDVEVQKRQGRHLFVGHVFSHEANECKTKKEYWRVSNLMLTWIREKISMLPMRTLLMTYGDINDDFGLARTDGNQFVPVHSHSVGSQRVGQEKFVSTQLRQVFEANCQAICSTFWKTKPTYIGHGAKSFIDTFTISLEHLSQVQDYRAMQRLAAQFIGITSKIYDHIPIMMFLFHHVAEKKKTSLFGIGTVLCVT